MDPRAYRNVLGEFATGVAIVATKGEGEQVVGRTINSFVSISLDPPLVGWCLDLESNTLGHFKNCDNFSLNFLSSNQQELALQMAKKGNISLCHSQVHSENGATPRITNALATLFCESGRQIEIGDHLMLIGRVSSFECKKDVNGVPLTFFRGKFGL